MDASRGSSGGEIRTFLIADVRGYTHFTEEHGDEQAAELAKKFAQLARDVVDDNGGVHDLCVRWIDLEDRVDADYEPQEPRPHVRTCRRSARLRIDSDDGPELKAVPRHERMRVSDPQRTFARCEINPATDRVIQSIQLPRTDGIAAGRDAVWVLNGLSQTAVKVNPATGKIVSRLVLPRTAEWANELGDSLWVGVWP